MKYLLLIFCLFCHSALAYCDVDKDDCAPIGQWQFSVAMGLGVHTNPLNGGDNIPLIVVPTISYYAEKLFFDNGTLGYSLINQEQLVISSIIELNLEKSYFTRWHPQNIFVNNFSSMAPSRESVDIAQVDNKRWAVDAGIQINWFINSTTDINAKLLHDVSSVYNGYTANVSINQTYIVPFIKNSYLNLGVGAQINSAELVDYYYGINQLNSLFSPIVFKGKTSINPILRVKLTKVLNHHWQLLFLWKRKLIDANTANSPLIEENQVDTVFLGMEYAF